MRALIIYCHPKADSFTAAIRDRVIGDLAARGADIRLTDLYAEGFDPVLTMEEFEGYEDTATNSAPVKAHFDNLAWCDTLIFIYPTWWYSPPAMLKGWLDRTLLPGLAFHMPAGPGDIIRPGLNHIHRLGVFTTCGASRWLTMFVGAPGRMLFMRGIGLLLHPGCHKAFTAHYLMDSSTPESRAKHLARVSRTVTKLMRGLR